MTGRPRSRVRISIYRTWAIEYQLTLAPLSRFYKGSTSVSRVGSRYNIKGRW